nr:AAA family ATPase [Ardenticatena sp.]
MPETLLSMIEHVPEHELFLPRAALLLGIPAYTEAWNALRAMSFYTLYPNTFREPAKPAMPYPLQDEGHNVASTLRSLRREDRKRYERIVKFLRAAVPGVEDVAVKQVGGYLVVEIRHAMHAKEDRRASFDLTQESDGTLRLLALFTALFQKPPRYVIGIEEPELNIHPGALPVLRDAIELACQESQILITTHSPELLSEFPPEVFRVVDLVDGITHVGPMSKYQLEVVREHLFTAGELFVREGLKRE